MQRCLPTLIHYAHRHECPLHVWGKDETFQYASPKFVIKRLLGEFLQGPADWCVWIDADVWIHPDAPLLTDDMRPGFHAVVDPSAARQIVRWYNWCRHYGWRPGRWVYRNVGVWVCDRDSAKRMLALMQEPFREGLQEQHHLNWWLYLMRQQGGATPELDRRWNAGVPHPPLDSWKGGWFLHLLSNKEAKLREIDRLGGFERFRPQA